MKKKRRARAKSKRQVSRLERLVNDSEKEALEDNEEWLPPPRGCRPQRAVFIGVVALIVLSVLLGFAAIHGYKESVPTFVFPTLQPNIYATSTPNVAGMLPQIYCNEAVQKIERNQIAYVLIYRQKDGGTAIPANAVINIKVLPRGISYQGDPAQSVQFNLLAIDTPYPDQTCYLQTLTAVQQVNKHLSKREQVKVGWY